MESGGALQGRVRLTGRDALHLAQSRRTRVGETLVVVDSARIEHGVVVDEVSRDAVAGWIVWSREATGDPRLRTHVLQALPQRGMDDAVEALSQVGATHIHPVLSSRTVPQPGEAASLRRLERWRTIAREAAQLAGRACTPLVHPIATLEDACAALPRDAKLIAAAVYAERPLARARIDVDRPVAIAIGPEGGFDAAELDVLRRAGAALVNLGPRVLPSRLAGAIALALVLQRAGELDAATTAAPTPSP
jgi:16S rRNA (uracil1498-N3)-methyltransferase